MKGLTATMTAAAREARNRGLAEWPIPLHKLEEIAEHMKRVDRLVLSVESWLEAYDSVRDDDPDLTSVRSALEEVLS